MESVVAKLSRGAWPSAGILVLGMLTACGGGHSGGDVCGLRIDYRGTTYTQAVVSSMPATGGPLGEATLPPCNDTNAAPSDTRQDTVTVTEIRGVSTDVAIAWNDNVLLAPGVTALPSPSPSQ